MSTINENNIPLIEIFEDFLKEKNIRLYVLREDLIHPEISGNKWRKLKYNVQEAKNQGFSKLVTYGGAYSNHIAATAAAGREFAIETIGIIRGEETLPLNNTLQIASNNGMKFKYVSRSFYRDNKYNSTFLEELKHEFGDFYLVPEGGSNAFAVKGCTEIKNNIIVDFDVITCANGTGGTIAGIIASLDNSKTIIGFPALKGGAFLVNDIQRLLNEYFIKFDATIENNNWSLNTEYHFGGYGKINNELVNFVNEFNYKHNVPLDLIYTGKMMFGIYQTIKTTNQFTGKKIVVVHTGGLQGNKGFEERFGIELF
ncbi:MAG: 1-aminocyclopropane-1-carboxylate deaminase/D-cysteine desulfhydrase [Bacteroidetes bacterium]|nr:1-aminocyclopropane-1-carboxylate deaminase/D-cysteine desulfhydrase [Bacteroidota bacterium]